jgi:CheY-like chemotaxis protein
MAKILLVEDNEINRDMLRRRLERIGYSVIAALDGEQGYSLAQSETADLILMDISFERLPPKSKISCPRRNLRKSAAGAVQAPALNPRDANTSNLELAEQILDHSNRNLAVAIEILVGAQDTKPLCCFR